jgi:hypothetical protein
MESADLRREEECRCPGTLLLLALVACVPSYSLAAPGRAAAVAAATLAGSQRRLLRSFQAAPHNYELALESCAGPVRLASPEAWASACTFSVSLLDGNLDVRRIRSVLGEIEAALEDSDLVERFNRALQNRGP